MILCLIILNVNIYIREIPYNSQRTRNQMLISLIKYSRPYTHINFQSAKNLVYRQPKRLLTTFEYSGKPTNISQTKEKVKGNKRKKKGNLPPNLRLPTSTPEILTKQPSLNKRESPQGHYFGIY